METQTDDASLVSQAHPGSALEVLRVATRLGLTSFGGPIAHLGYFHAEKCLGHLQPAYHRATG